MRVRVGVRVRVWVRVRVRVKVRVRVRGHVVLWTRANFLYLHIFLSNHKAKLSV